MTLQIGRLFGLVLFKRKVTDKEVGPPGQRQSGTTKRFLVLFRTRPGDLVMPDSFG